MTGTVSLLSRPDLEVRLASGYNPLPGTSFVILANDGTDAISGIFEEVGDDGTRSPKGPRWAAGVFASLTAGARAMTWR